MHATTSMDMEDDDVLYCQRSTSFQEYDDDDGGVPPLVRRPEEYYSYSSPNVRATTTKKTNRMIPIPRRSWSSSTTGYHHDRQYSPHSWIHSLQSSMGTSPRGLSSSFSSTSSSSSSYQRRNKASREEHARLFSSNATGPGRRNNDHLPPIDHHHRRRRYQRPSGVSEWEEEINVEYSVSSSYEANVICDFVQFPCGVEDDGTSSSVISDLSCDSSFFRDPDCVREASLQIDDVFADQDDGVEDHMPHHPLPRPSSHHYISEEDDDDDDDVDQDLNYSSSTSLLVDYIKSTTSTSTCRNDHHNHHYRNKNASSSVLLGSIMFDPTWGIATATLVDHNDDNDNGRHSANVL